MLNTFDFLDKGNKEKDVVVYPEGISEVNSSGKAYAAILELSEEKKRYIKSHSKKTDYRTEKVYLVQRSEVSKVVSTAVQTLFNSSTYSKILQEQLNLVNDKLRQLKEDKLEDKQTRTKAKSKDTIYSENLILKEKVKKLEAKRATDEINTVINRMTLSAKKILLP